MSLELYSPIECSFELVTHIFERMLDESLAEVTLENLTLHMVRRAANKLFKEHPDVLPSKVCGIKLSVYDEGKRPHFVDTLNGDVIVHRIVPEAYLWYQANNRAWTIPLEYQF